MRFAKILLVCFGLLLLAGLRANPWSAASVANPRLKADGGEPFPPKLSQPLFVADGGEPFPPKPQSLLVADGGEPFPPKLSQPLFVADGGEPFPPKPSQAVFGPKAAS